MNARWLTALIAALTLCSPACGDNLLTNGDFESGPPGPGVAAGWNPFQIPPSSPAVYEVTNLLAYNGIQSQRWSSASPFDGGIWQVVTGLEPGVVAEASVYVCSPYAPGSAVLRIGIEPNGGPPDSPGVIWSSTVTVGPTWQEIAVQAALTGPAASVIIRSTSAMPGGVVFVDGAFFVFKYARIANVPDYCQSAADNTNNNYCGPIAAANVTQYWDVVKANPNAVGVNAGLGKAASAHLAYWMDTNDAGCPYRWNGCGIQPYSSAGGTYVGDIAPGVAQFARWDANNSFGCTPPPNLPANKNGYSWSVDSFTNNGNNLQALWNQLVAEISAGRPLLVTWAYWNLDATNHVRDAAKDIDFYQWGAPSGGNSNPEHQEEWNEPYDPTAGIAQIGHIVTAVGYWSAYDPDGLGPLPKDNWVIVHDTWCDTPANVALPMYRSIAQQTTAWSANTLIRLQAPAGGGLNESLGLKSPKDHWGGMNAANVMIQLKLTETSGNQSAQVNAVKLTAFGTGDDQNDISGVELWDDVNADGTLDAGDSFLATSGSGYPSDNGTMTIRIPGPKFNVPASSSRYLLVVYRMNANGSHGDTYKFGTPTLYVTGSNSFLPIAPNVAWFLTSAKKLSTFTAQPCPPVGAAKQQRDGTLIVYINCSPVVSAGTGAVEQSIYVQEPDGSAGIKVYFGDQAAPTLVPGDVLEFEAYIDTIDGERALVQPAVFGAKNGPPPKPLAMANRDIGGGDWFYDAATGAGQKGIAGAAGLNNIGLLVRTFGRVVESDPAAKWFSIDDGSRLAPPLKIKLPEWWTAAVPAPPAYVTVTGICSCEPGGTGGLARLIRVRALDDVRTALP